MGKILSQFAAWLNPVVVFFGSMAGLGALILGCIADPAGAVNQFICMVIDMIASVFPSTPPNLTVAGLIQSVGESMPAVGTAVIKDVLTTLGAIFALTLVIKIYKLIPFKAT